MSKCLIKSYLNRKMIYFHICLRQTLSVLMTEQGHCEVTKEHSKEIFYTLKEAKATISILLTCHSCEYRFSF